jgi:hypothetical protein
MGENMAGQPAGVMFRPSLPPFAGGWRASRVLLADWGASTAQVELRKGQRRAPLIAVVEVDLVTLELRGKLPLGIDRDIAQKALVGAVTSRARHMNRPPGAPRPPRRTRRAGEAVRGGLQAIHPPEVTSGSDETSASRREQETTIMINRPTLTFDVTTEEARELHEQRAKHHEHAAREWETRASDPIWCKRTSIENAKVLRVRAQQQGTPMDKIPDETGIAEFARGKSAENIEAARYVRQMGAHLSADSVFSLNQEDFLNLFGDISKKICPIDPPVEKLLT